MEANILEKIKFIVLVITYLTFGVLNNVGSTMMGYVMPAFPTWLLYGTTAMYALLFFFYAISVGQNPFARKQIAWPRFKQYLWLALWTSLNGIFFQFSDPWIDADLQQILTCLQVPATFIFSKLLFKTVLSHLRESIGSLIVVAGIVVGLIPYITVILKGSASSQGDYWPWVLAFTLSIFFAAWEQVWQEKAFQEYNCDEAPTLFWYNLISFPVYLFTIPCEAVRILNGTHQSQSMKEAFNNQGRAFACYFGHPSKAEIASGACSTHAWVWPTLFVVGYAGTFLLGAKFIKQYNAFFAIILGSLIQPLSLVVFSFSSIVGLANYKQIHPMVVVSFVIIIVGIVVKSRPTPVPEEKQPLIN